MSQDTPDLAPLNLDAAWAESVDFDDPATPQDEVLAAIRALLARRVNLAPAPSRAVNQLYAAHQRCAHGIQQLERLAARAPRILSLIRHLLRESFALDPDTLLFSEPLPPQPAAHVNSLTDRALDLFRDPGLPINLHHFTALSLANEPGKRLPFNAWEVMDRVRKLGLFARINDAMTAYWQQLANGTWLSRRSRWVELRKALFADQAYLAHQLFQLSAVGYAMAKQLVDAPTVQARQQAGGAWATLRVGQVQWPHSSAGVLTIPGSLHLYREGAADAPHVIYLPGLQRTFHEFASWQQVQAQLPALIERSLFSTFWQYLPFKHRSSTEFLLQPSPVLRGDALAHSAQAVLDGQWNNEWGSVLSLDYSAPKVAEATLPSRRATRLLRFIEKGRKQLNRGLPLETALEVLLAWDWQRRQAEILLASLSSDLPRNGCERQLQRYERGLEVLLARDEPGGESVGYTAFLKREGEHQGALEVVNRWMQGEPQHVFQKAFWLERPDATYKRATLVLNARRMALRLEAQLEHSLNLIQQPHLDRLLEVLDTPRAAQRTGSDTRVLRIEVGGSAETCYRLMGVFVVTTASAVATPDLPQPVLLVVGGAEGGLTVFEHVDALSHGLRASFGSHDGSVLWRCIGRDLRAAARFSMARQVDVSYVAEEHDVLKKDFETLFMHHVRLDKRLNEPGGLFTEVSDPALGRQLLAQALREHLQVPINQARALALANLELMRFAARQASTQPAWLVTADAIQRKRYTRLQRRYVASASAMENRLWQVLPQLYAFARGLLVAQLTRDGFYPALDIDQPLLNMPDDVSAHLCGWSSQCVPGDRHIKITASTERTTFSLLELALHNLDALAPWTEWRLNRARYVLPAWKDRLTPRYLIKTLSALDIGGQYDALIKRAFHPASTDLERRLIDRATEHQAQMQVFSAARLGLSAEGQSLFTAAMNARTPVELGQHGHLISLNFLRLRGYTMEQDRHIAGLLVLIDDVSLRCLVYWPGAMAYPVLSEYATWAQAEIALNQACATPENIQALAQRIAPGWEAQALASYPGQPPITLEPVPLLSRIKPSPVLGYAILKTYEAISRFVRSFKIKHKVPTADLQAIEAQIKEQVEAQPSAWLALTPTSHSDVRALLAHARMLEVQQRAKARATSGATLAHYREQRLGEQWDASVRGVLSFIPVIGVGISLYEMLLAARRFHLSGRPEDAVDVAFLTLMAFVDVLLSFLPATKGTRSGALRRGLNHLHRQNTRLARLPSAPRPTKIVERFKKAYTLDEAVPLQGPGEKGVYVKNGEQFLVEGEHRYSVYRRRDEQLLRMKSPDAEAGDELLLFIHEDREWSVGADAPPPSPQPGPSSRVFQPFSAQTASQWVPPSWGALEQRMRQTLSEPRSFESWAVTAHLALTESLPERGIFEVAGVPLSQRYRVVQHRGRHYRVLPDGSQVSARDLIFITRDRALEHSASLDLAFWLEVGLFDQPIPATFGVYGEWTIHRPLFSESFRVSLARAFPGMTANSRTFLIERLLELSDASRRLTAKHLLDFRASLDVWLAPGAVGQTDDLLKLLRPLDSNTRTSVYIGNEPSTPGFDRVDFLPRHPLHASLRETTQQNMIQRAHVVQGEVRMVLERQGFIVRTQEKKPGSAASIDFVCTHPQSNNLYYVLTRWANTSSVKLFAAHAMQLTDEWFRHRSRMWNYNKAFAPVIKALDEKRLVKIIAGIQWTPTAPPTVYFARFGSLKPGAALPHRQRQKRPHSPG